MILKNKSAIKSTGNAETHGSPKTQPAHFTSEKTQPLPAQVIPLENDFKFLAYPDHISHRVQRLQLLEMLAI